MNGLILHIYDYFAKNRLSYWLILILSITVLSFLAFRVSFEEDISKIFQIDSKTREYRNILQNSHALEKLIVCIRDKDSRRSDAEVKMRFCDSLAARVNALDTSLVRKVVIGPDDFPFLEVYNAMLRNLPFFIENQDYAHIDTVTNADYLDHHLAESVKLLYSPTGIMIQQSLPLDPAGLSSPMTLRLQTLGQNSAYDIDNGYFFLKNKRALIFFIQPANPVNETSKNAVLLQKVRALIDELESKEEFFAIDCFMVGSTVTSVGNATQVRRDTAITVTVMSIALIFLITAVFRKKRTPLLIFSPVLFGVIFALACISFIKPGISLIAIGATSVLLGIAVNYPLHILTHRLYEADVRRVIADMVEPMTIGSLTTIGGFVCLLFVKAELLHDFGLLGAFGLIGAVLFSLIFLPHLIGEQPLQMKTRNVERWLGKVGDFQLDNNKYLLWSILLLTPVLLFFCKDIKFDSDLMNLNYMSPQLRENEKFLRSSDTLNSPIYIVSSGKTFDQALSSAGNIKRLSDSLNAAGIPTRYTGISDFLPSLREQRIRIEKWHNYFDDQKKHSVQSALTGSGDKYGFRNTAFNGFYSMLDTKAEKIDSVDFQLLISAVGKEAITTTPEMTTIVSILYSSNSVRPAIESLLSKQAGNNVLDSKILATQLTSVINDDFNFIAVFSAILVFLALLLTYGRLELAITAFVPMVVSWIWILGLMSLFHLKFNIVNIILSTFIFGLGDDYCIFTMNGLLNEYRLKKAQMPVIRISILLSGLTTLLGFGVMLIAKHPALQSIAAVSVIGISSVLLISQVLEPYLFKFFISKPVSRGEAPISILTFLKSVVAYGFFILGCIFLTMAGVVLLVINPFYRKRAQKLFNWLICKLTWAQIYVMTNITKRFIYIEKPDYSKPFVLVANHQSVIDILAILSLSSKIILITNNWVWHSPLFGFVVRLAGFYPVFEGVEPSLDRLKAKVREGYSIAIFPEGTRSMDGQIKHFHKGAFYLAQQLELDIIPVVIHGTRDCIAKGSFIVRDGIFTLKILPRIHFNDPQFGLTYQEVTKKVQELFRYHSSLIETELRKPELLRKRLFGNFLFKGPVLEWYMKVKIRIEGNYSLVNSLVPENGVIIDAGCGYGFMSYMLAYLSPHRKITGFDYDKEKIEVAENGFDKPGNLIFRSANLIDYPIGECDCIIFGDVLHYMKEKQRNRIFTDGVSSLLPGGCIIVRDADRKPGKKHFITRLSELFSIKLLKFNKIENDIEFFTARDLIGVGEKLGLKASIINEKKWSSNVMIVFRKNSDGK